MISRAYFPFLGGIGGAVATGLMYNWFGLEAALWVVGWIAGMALGATKMLEQAHDTLVETVFRRTSQDDY